MCFSCVVLINVKENRRFGLTPYITQCCLVFDYRAVFFFFSDHQQWVQPSFIPPVLPPPLPIKVSVTSYTAEESFSTYLLLCIHCQFSPSVMSILFRPVFVSPVMSLYLQTLPSHSLHTGSPSHADVRWSTPVQQHAAVNCLHCLLPDRAAIRTVHLWYEETHTCKGTQ